MADVPLQTKITDILDLPTSEADTALVLHPDGTGGVEWGTGASGSGGSLPADKDWVATNDHSADYPASPDATYDDEFNDDTGMSGAVNGLNARWTWRNQGTATATFSKSGHVTLAIPAASTNNWRMIDQALPVSGDWAYEAHVALEGAWATNCMAALIAIDGVNNDFYMFGVAFEPDARFQVQYWSSLTSWNANTWVEDAGVNHSGYFRIIKTGTDLAFWYSVDGIGWIRATTVASAQAVTRIGLGLAEKNNTGITKLHSDYFRRIS